ncbi:hypothetical protein ABTH62_18540, partial [Acinetobacter baumannii]
LMFITSFGEQNITYKCCSNFLIHLSLQSFRDWDVVFIRVGNDFEARPLELGEKYNGYVEVKSGLRVGQVYAAGNSYLLKAELGKSGATHDH